MFNDRNKGKIIIHIENENGKLNSTMEFLGMAEKPETALTTLLVNFVSLSKEKGKDPKELIDKHLEGILQMIEQAKKL
jgi:hypothetical protein